MKKDLDVLWEERKELEEIEKAETEVDEDFVPAKLAEPTPPDQVLFTAKW